MKKTFKKLNILIRTWLWERNRGKNIVLKTRKLYPDDRLTFYPYESDYDYLIHQYCKINRENFLKLGRYTGVYTFLFRLYMKNGEILLGFPIKFSNNILTLKKEKSEPDGYHTAQEEKIDIHIFKIEYISALRDSDDFHGISVDEPIMGYKAIPEENGKLTTYSCTYKLNEKKEVDIRNPYETDFQDCYLHFCTSMEGVALCPGSTDYLTSIKNYVDGYSVIRLFRVKAEGHCVNMKGDWWVTNTLTVLEEVSKNEIYRYYMENPKSREQVSAKLDLSPDFWNEFLESEITPYVEKQ